MDWDKAIERNGLALLRIVATLFGLFLDARLSGSGLFVPRHVWRKVLVVLRPAEAALRRLIIIAARGLALSPSPLRGPKAGETCGSPWSVRGGGAAFAEITRNPLPLAPTFQLFDPLKPFTSQDEEAGPQGCSAKSGDDLENTPVNAQLLFNRLRALRHALADIPKQAARLARYNVRRDALLKAGRPVRTSLMRPGLPPGWHERPKHEVDTVLKECHRLVRYLDDTS